MKWNDPNEQIVPNQKKNDFNEISLTKFKEKLEILKEEDFNWTTIKFIRANDVKKGWGIFIEVIAELIFISLLKGTIFPKKHFLTDDLRVSRIYFFQ